MDSGSDISLQPYTRTREPYGAEVRSSRRRDARSLRAPPHGGLLRRRLRGRHPRGTTRPGSGPFPSARDPQATRIGGSPGGADGGRRNDRGELLVDPTGPSSDRTAEAPGRRLASPDGSRTSPARLA